MNEFIVWDNKNKVFGTIQDLINQSTILRHLVEAIESGVITKHNFIGKIDTNGKKIYADCSIVEFEYRDYRYLDVKKAFGYFSFNNDKKCLEFVNLDSILKINFVNHIEFIIKLKIIDTIQENKLGLVKLRIDQ